MSSQQAAREPIQIGQLLEADLDEADHIFRLAFGTFIGITDPLSFHNGADYVHTRWKADPTAAFAAKIRGRLVGTNFATNWGTVGFFGPLTIHPDYWDRGIGRLLIEPVIDLFSEWKLKHAGLFTFAQSPKHIALYQKFGFWPRFLTALMSLQVTPPAASTKVLTFSELTAGERDQCLNSCRELTSQIYPGLDVRNEILAIASQELGDTVLLIDSSGVTGLAACHCGEGSEAGPELCYVKFAAVRPGSDAYEDFGRLLVACEALAARRRLGKLLVGVNTARIEAYRHLLARGFRTEMQGVAMHAPNEPAYSQPGKFVLDDWR